MKGHVKHKLQLWRLAKGFFHGQLAPSPSGVACVPRLPTAFVSPHFARPLWFPWGVLVTFSFRFLPLVLLPETLSLLRFA
jgi:hypothetical protein